MRKRLLCLVIPLAGWLAPIGAGEYAETGPASAPLRRVTSTSSRADEGGGRTRVRVTIPSGGVRHEPRYLLVDSTESGPDGSLEFDIENGVEPELADIPGVFTPDLLAMDAADSPVREDVYASFASPDVEVLAPMELAEDSARPTQRPDPVALPPPLGGQLRPEELSAMAAPAMPAIGIPGDREATRARVPPTSVRLPGTPPRTEVRLTDTTPAQLSLRPPPQYSGAGIPSPGELRLTDVPPRGLRRGPGRGMTMLPEPPAKPARAKERPLPVGKDGFTPMRRMKNLYVPPPDPSLWGD